MAGKVAAVLVSRETDWRRTRSAVRDEGDMAVRRPAGRAGRRDSGEFRPYTSEVPRPVEEFVSEITRIKDDYAGLLDDPGGVVADQVSQFAEGLPAAVTAGLPSGLQSLRRLNVEDLSAFRTRLREAVESSATLMKARLTATITAAGPALGAEVRNLLRSEIGAITDLVSASCALKQVRNLSYLAGQRLRGLNDILYLLNGIENPQILIDALKARFGITRLEQLPVQKLNEARSLVRGLGYRYGLRSRLPPCP